MTSDVKLLHSVGGHVLSSLSMTYFLWRHSIMHGQDSDTPGPCIQMLAMQSHETG